MWVLLIAMVAACSNKKEEVQQLKNEVLKVHDEVMPKMDEVMKLKRQLKEHMQKDSVDSIMQQKINVKVKALDQADAEMMNWMHQFDPMMENMKDQEKIDYLKEQKQKIDSVKTSVFHTMQEAENFMKDSL